MKTTKTITLYYHPDQKLLHMLTAEVNQETGAHKIINSQVWSTASKYNNYEYNLASDVWYFSQLVGAENVRAYTVREFVDTTSPMRGLRGMEPNLSKVI